MRGGGGGGGRGEGIGGSEAVGLGWVAGWDMTLLEVEGYKENDQEMSDPRGISMRGRRTG